MPHTVPYPASSGFCHALYTSELVSRGCLSVWLKARLCCGHQQVHDATCFRTRGTSLRPHFRLSLAKPLTGPGKMSGKNGERVLPRDPSAASQPAALRSRSHVGLLASEADLAHEPGHGSLKAFRQQGHGLHEAQLEAGVRRVAVHIHHEGPGVDAALVREFLEAPLAMVLPETRLVAASHTRTRP